MRINITDGERNICIPLPTSLLFSDLTAYICTKAIERYVPERAHYFNDYQLKALFQAIRQIKRQRGSWVLVDVKSADGQTVKITI